VRLDHVASGIVNADHGDRAQGSENPRDWLSYVGR